MRQGKYRAMLPPQVRQYNAMKSILRTKIALRSPFKSHSLTPSALGNREHKPNRPTVLTDHGAFQRKLTKAHLIRWIMDIPERSTRLKQPGTNIVVLWWETRNSNNDTSRPGKPSGSKGLNWELCAREMMTVGPIRVIVKIQRGLRNVLSPTIQSFGDLNLGCL